MHSLRPNLKDLWIILVPWWIKVVDQRKNIVKNTNQTAIPTPRHPFAKGRIVIVGGTFAFVGDNNRREAVLGQVNIRLIYSNNGLN